MSEALYLYLIFFFSLLPRFVSINNRHCTALHSFPRIEYIYIKSFGIKCKPVLILIIITIEIQSLALVFAGVKITPGGNCTVNIGRSEEGIVEPRRKTSRNTSPKRKLSGAYTAVAYSWDTNIDDRQTQTRAQEKVSVSRGLASNAG